MLSGDGQTTPAVSIAAGVVIGLVSALVQSLGLTLQRKSLIGASTIRCYWC